MSLQIFIGPTCFLVQIVFSALTTFHSPDLLYVIRENGNFSQAVPDSVFHCALRLCHVQSLVKLNLAACRSGKSTHISTISNSVTHQRSYTNTAIADIAGNSARSPASACQAPTSPHRAPTSPHREPISSHHMTSVSCCSQCFKSVS